MKLGNKNGVGALGTLVSIIVLAALGAGVMMMTATNQITRNQILYMEQAYYNSHAAYEYALRQINQEGNPNPIPTRQFMGKTPTITRTADEIRVQTSFGDASVSLTMTDPG